MSIPKKIHYCWFGGAPMGRRAGRCMESWRRFCPDFELIRWDESNAPLKDNDYVRQAFRARKWAFVSDYVRLAALCDQGGIYLDTDVELLAPLEPFLTCEAFLGFESHEKVATCLMACRPGHPLFRRAAACDGTRQFLRPDGSVDDTTNVELMTTLLVGEGLVRDNRMQEICGVSVYPSAYFSPKSLETGRITLTEHTCAVHYFQASWMPAKKRLNARLAQLLGPEATRSIKRRLGRD